MLFRLPPHSTHMTQPLDVGVFQPFKHYHTEAIDQAVRLGDTRFGTLEFLAAFQQFRAKTFKSSTVKHAFEVTGLVPFNPEVVLEKVRANQPVRTPSPPSTPSTTTNETPREARAIIKQGRRLQTLIKKQGRLYIYDVPTVQRFVRGAMAGAHTHELVARDLEATLYAASERHKRASLKSTVASKAGVIKVSECRELASARAKKEAEKEERAKQRKEKAAQKKAESQAKRSSKNNAPSRMETT